MSKFKSEIHKTLIVYLPALIQLRIVSQRIKYIKPLSKPVSFELLYNTQIIKTITFSQIALKNGVD